MADARLPLLRGRITKTESYKGPRGGPASAAQLPSRDPQLHRTRLVQQLDAIADAVKNRPALARDELATREIVAIQPATGAELVADQLDDVQEDARLIGVGETGTLLLDVASAQLEYLRDKLDAFADDSRIKPKVNDDGTTTVRRDKERAIAPIETISLATLDDVRAPRLRETPLVADRAYWFELACRGGAYRPLLETEMSRTQILRQLHRLDALQKVEEFVGPEQVYFFVRLTLNQLDALRSATDCIYEIELAPPPIRDLHLLEDISSKDVKAFDLIAPPENAPSVVILDTGIATQHPLLKKAILSATTAGEFITSPEDTHGHGTKMAGIALYRDLGTALEHGTMTATHWLQSSRLFVRPKEGTAHDNNYEAWPVLTLGAVRAAEDADLAQRDRVFALAITRSMQEPLELQDSILDEPTPTLWSHALDQIAFNDGRGRLIVVSAGNARPEQWLTLAEQYPQLQLSEKIHQPAQASNVLTIGAFTSRVELPGGQDYAEYRVVAPRPGGISPFTSAGLPGKEWPIKPDIVLEGGNLAIAGALPDESIPTLCGLTTSHRHMVAQPLGHLSMTSEATARAANLAARVWAAEPKLRPETVRALLVHSASWTRAMMEQFSGKSDRLRACGYGVPDERLAMECAKDRATIIIEDTMPNAVIEEVAKKKPPKRATTKPTEPKPRRKAKLYRLPIPHELLTDADSEVELRVTLSYYPEPNKFRRSILHGLDLKWDMQGPQETEEQFIQRINTLNRPRGSDGKPQKVTSAGSFSWDVGIDLRSRGTVQSDRWRGKMSALAGDKLIAIVPVLGWWNQRKQMTERTMRFSLVVSVFGPGVYAVIKPKVELPVAASVEV